MTCAYLITVVFYQFFNSVNNEEMVIFVVMTNVSSVEPAIAVNCLGSSFWVVEVTCNNIKIQWNTLQRSLIITGHENLAA